jgi:hypothetical protein
MEMNKEQSLTSYLYHMQNSEWNLFEEMTHEDFEAKIHWTGMKYSKEEFISLIKVLVEEDLDPRITKFEIISEINCSNYSVLQLRRKRHNERPPECELLIADWDDKKIRSLTIYNVDDLDHQLAGDWMKSFQSIKKY